MKTALLTAFAVLSCLLLTLPSQAQDDVHAKAIREMFQAMEIEKTVNETLGTTAQILASQTENPAKARPLMEKFVHDTIGFKAVEADMVNLYKKHFTISEIQDIVKFYKTPAGKKWASSQTVLFKEGAQIGQAKLLAKQEELQKIIEQINKK